MDKAKSIELLNHAVADELPAVHQYMYFHFHLDDQGLGPLSVLFKRVAIQEMGHVERLAERILFLKGDVNMKTAGEVERIAEPEQMLAKAVQMEEESARSYNEAALQCGANADSVSAIWRSNRSTGRRKAGSPAPTEIQRRQMLFGAGLANC